MAKLKKAIKKQQQQTVTPNSEPTSSAPSEARPNEPTKKERRAENRAQAQELGIGKRENRRINKSGGDAARYAELKKKRASGQLTQEEEAEYLKLRQTAKKTGGSKNLDQKARGSAESPAIQHFLDESLQTGNPLARGIEAGSAGLAGLLTNPGMLIQSAHGADPYAAMLSDIAARNAQGTKTAIAQNLAQAGRTGSAGGQALMASADVAAGRAQADAARTGTIMNQQLARADLAQTLPLIQERQSETQFGRQMLAGESAKRDAAAQAARQSKIDNVKTAAALAGAAFTGGASLAMLPDSQSQPEYDPSKPVSGGNMGTYGQSGPR